jgi:hypothetical protein
MGTTPSGPYADGSSGESPLAPPGSPAPADERRPAAPAAPSEVAGPVARTPDLTPEALRAVSQEVALQFPAPFDETELVLMDVDPHRVHAYWHVAGRDLAAAQEQAGGARSNHLVLRVRDVTPDESDLEGYPEPFDIEVQGLDSHCYVDLWQDGRTYEAELGLRAPDDSLIGLARSNRVETPHAGPRPRAAAVAPPAAIPPPRATAAEPEAAPQPELRTAGALKDENPVPSAAVAPYTPVRQALIGPFPEAPYAALRESLFGRLPEAPSVPIGEALFRPVPETLPAAAQESLFGPLPEAPSVPIGGTPFGHAPEVPSAALQESLFGPLPEAPSVPIGEAPFGHTPGAPGPSQERSFAEAPEVALQVPPGQGLVPEFPNAFPGPGTGEGITGPGGDGTAYQAVDGALLPDFDAGSTTAPAGVATDTTGDGGPLDTGGEPFVTYSSSALAGSPLLEINAELHVYGRARPGSRLRIFGRPVVLRPDGSFSVRRPLPTGAVVLPIQLEDPDPAQPGPGESG